MKKLLKILLVDDDEIDRMAVRRAFKKAELELDLIEAEDAKTAIAILKDSSFDCIFLDYLLPDIDGLDFVKKLPSLGIKVPVIVLTGQGDEQIAVEMMKAGAYDYLTKSRISAEILSRTLRQAMRVHEAEKEAELANKKLRDTNRLLREKNQELERQRQQIELQNLELQEAYQLKSKFLSTLSHELRTPMNAVMGFSQILLNHSSDPLTVQQKDMVQRIYNNSQNLLTMINEVLDFSKIEAGQMKLHSEAFNLANLIQITVEELRSLAVQKNLTLEVDIDLENPLVINDQNSCRRIFINLLANALKFTPNGGVWVKVWAVNSEKVVISVKDTGIGIDSKHLETIFEPFRQVDQTTTRKYSGTGLGLAISYSQVKMMQGQISVESKLGQGSIFKVEIPRQLTF